MSTIIKNLGPATAYGYAKEKGYTGTEEQYAELMASYATVAESAAASATAAAGSADAASTKATAAANSATAASNSATTATTKAGEAATSATNAANSANTANTKAGEAASSATAASGSASTASTKAGEASASATAAAGSATEASGSATSANTNALKAEGYAVGQQNGTDVASGSPYYENNAKYYSEEAAASAASIDPDTLAKIDGSYESMTVGNAEQIVSTVGIDDSTSYNFRTSGGTADIGDREHVNAVVGGTVAWNQYCDYNESTPTENWSLTNATLSIGGRKMTITSSSNSSTRKGVTLKTFLSTANHKYLVSGYITPDASNNAVYGFYNGGIAVDRKIVPYADGKADISTIFGISASGYDFEILTANATPSGSSCVAEDVMLIDLTLALGSTIADYIYSLEQATAGAGVAYFRKLFPKPFYEFNSGELLSVNTSQHKMVGFNQWDEEWENGVYNVTTGAKADGATQIRSKNFIPVLPNTTYYAYCSENSGAYIKLLFYAKDSTDSLISSPLSFHNGTFTVPDGAYYMTFYLNANYGTTYHNDICINLSWDGERDGEYEPYQEWVYPLDSSLELRGVPKLDANSNLYYDGDTYESDGTVTRKYGIVDLGTLGDWLEYSGYPGLFYLNVTPSGVKIPASNTVLPSLIANGYIAGISRDIGTSGHTKGEIALAANRTYISNDTYAGNASGFRTAISGVYLVYELATPTTETAEPYTQTQSVDDFGTEEYTDAAVAAGTRDVSVPVGHDTFYQNNLRAKLEMAPDSPDGNGDYIVRQTNGQNEYVPLVIPNELPAMPSTDGTYTLQVTVADGTATLSWV